ncbi:hypothetical protein [Flavobacterium hauense]
MTATKNPYFYSMKDFPSLYVAQIDNKVVVCNSNLKDFVISLNSVVKNLKPYMFYYRLFKKIDYIEHVTEDGRKFYLQKVF